MPSPYQEILPSSLPQIWSSDGVVILPTDTLYGMTCCASSAKAVAKVYQLKKRPLDKLVPVLVDSLEMVQRHCGYSVNAEIKNLLNHFWPGGLTLVLSVMPDRPLGFMGTVGFRMPNSPYLLRAIKALGEPIVGTSSNFSGERSIISSAELTDYLARLKNNFPQSEGIYFCYGEGNEPSGIQSTVIKYNEEFAKVELIREGAVDFAKITDLFKK